MANPKLPAFDLAVQAGAMTAYARSMTQSARAKQTPWHASMVEAIEREREAIRVDEGGGGMCHVVTEWLQAKHGWERIPATYLDEESDVVSAGHVVSILPDGSLLDPTADQMGEGDSVRVIAPSDPMMGRYRPEFDDDLTSSRP